MYRRGILAGMAAGAVASPAVAQPARILRFAPQANLMHPDPTWTNATVALNSGFMIWDTLYGLDAAMVPHPQMVSGHEVSADEKTWTFTLREGLRFHDGAPVRGVDCVASIRRWGSRDSLGRRLLAVVEEMTTPDDRRFIIRLKQPFRMMIYALAYKALLIMPERMARTPGTQGVTEFVGSGPFVFKQDEWVAGDRVVFTRFDGYRPRPEPADNFAGGKVVHFDRVEWIVQPDEASALMALQQGRLDWVDEVLIDYLPNLRRSNNITAVPLDPLGSICLAVINHLHPPFNNPAFTRAILSAIGQTEIMQAVVGASMDLARVPMGFFPNGAPAANQAGMEALTSPRNLDAAKRAIAASGYANEPITIMSSADRSNYQAMAQVLRDLFVRLGLNVDFQSMDWGTLVARRSKKEPPAQGGWNLFCTTWSALSTSIPITSDPLQATGQRGFFGWHEDAGLDGLIQQSADAADAAALKTAGEAIQQRAFSNPPFLPLGQYRQPTAYRNNLTGFMNCFNKLFWNVRRT